MLKRSLIIALAMLVVYNLCLLSPRVRRLIDGDETIWEHGPLEALASLGELVAYEHDDFWHPMDTLRDKNLLEAMWASGKAPWRNW